MLSIYIYTFRSLQNPGLFEVAGKTSTDIRRLFLSLRSMLSFPLNSQQKKTHQKQVYASFEAQLKTRISCKWHPTGTVSRCLSCCVCRLSRWAATHPLGNTFLQQQASLNIWGPEQKAIPVVPEDPSDSSTPSMKLSVEQHPRGFSLLKHVYKPSGKELLL